MWWQTRTLHRLDLIHEIRSSGGKVPLSPAFGGAAAPGAFGTENFANVTGLKVVGFLAEAARVFCLPSVRLVSDSEPP